MFDDDDRCPAENTDLSGVTGVGTITTVDCFDILTS